MRFFRFFICLLLYTTCTIQAQKSPIFFMSPQQSPEDWTNQEWRNYPTFSCQANIYGVLFHPRQALPDTLHIFIERLFTSPVNLPIELKPLKEAKFINSSLQLIYGEFLKGWDIHYFSFIKSDYSLKDSSDLQMMHFFKQAFENKQAPVKDIFHMDYSIDELRKQGRVNIKIDQQDSKYHRSIYKLKVRQSLWSNMGSEERLLDTIQQLEQRTIDLQLEKADIFEFAKNYNQHETDLKQSLSRIPYYARQYAKNCLRIDSLIWETALTQSLNAPKQPIPQPILSLDELFRVKNFLLQQSKHDRDLWEGLILYEKYTPIQKKAILISRNFRTIEKSIVDNYYLIQDKKAKLEEIRAQIIRFQQLLDKLEE